MATTLDNADIKHLITVDALLKVLLDNTYIAKQSELIHDLSSLFQRVQDWELNLIKPWVTVVREEEIFLKPYRIL